MISWEEREAGDRRSETSGRFSALRFHPCDQSPGRLSGRRRHFLRAVNSGVLGIPLQGPGPKGADRAPRSFIAFWLCLCCGTVPGPRGPVSSRNGSEKEERASGRKAFLTAPVPFSIPHAGAPSGHVAPLGLLLPARENTVAETRPERNGSKTARCLG